MTILAAAPVRANESENVSLLGHWGEGPCLALEAVDEIAFFGNGAILEIVDFGDPNNQGLISRVPLDGPILGVCVDGGMACVATGAAGLRVIDVSDPTHAFQSGAFLSPGCVEELALIGTFAYLAAGEAGLRVVDISDPAAPFEAGFLDTPGYADDIVVTGDTAYIGDGNSLRIIDVSDAADPVEIGFLSTSSAYEKIFGLDVAGNHAYLVTQRTLGGGDRGLRIIDISDPAFPSEAGFLDTFNEAFDVFVSGTHAFVAAGTAGLRVIDVSDPATATEVGFANTTERIYGVEVSDGQAFVATWWDGVTVIDVQVPTAPYRTGFFDTPGQASSVCLWDHFAYVADGPAGLRVIDVSDPTAPVEVGYYETSDWATSVYQDGGRIYVADRNDGLYILQNDLVSGAPGNDLPEVTSLQGVFPNPFNPQMSVSFSLAQPQRVNLAVFDLAGSQVAVIADRVFGSGKHTVPWNGRDASGRAVSSGVYVVRMEAAGLRESLKVTLLR